MPKVRASINSLQGRYEKQDSSVATRFLCATCLTSYYAEKAKCPLCDVNKRLVKTQEAMAQMARELEAEKAMTRKLSEQIDGTFAIRGALELLDDNDRSFLKTVLYQWKIDRSVNLRVTHGGRLRGKSRPRANGFIATFRGSGDKAQEPTAHLCTSMGGLAIADYFEEGLNEKGQQAAMTMLLKGLNELLPGALDA